MPEASARAQQRIAAGEASALKFYLARHCESEKGEQLDPTRGLTDTGWTQCEVIAEFLETQTDNIGAVLCSSDLARGRDTGERIAKELDVEVLYSPLVDPPNNAGTVTTADIRRCWKEIQKQAKALGDKELLVVSHGPLINALAAWLIGSQQGDRFHFSHGAVTKWDTEDPGGGAGYPVHGRGAGVIAYLHWMVSAKLMVRALEQDRGAIIEAASRVADGLLQSLGMQLDEAGRPYYYDITMVKRAIPEADACELCESEAEEGWIPDDDVFPNSGEDAPEFHFGCRCQVEYKEQRTRVYV